MSFYAAHQKTSLFCFPGAFQYRSDLQSVHLYQSTGGFHIFVMASEALYFLFIVYYMVEQVCTLSLPLLVEWIKIKLVTFFGCRLLMYWFPQGKLMRQQKINYFRSKWNLLELAIIILSWSSLCVFIKRTLLGNRDIEYYHNHKDQYVYLFISDFFFFYSYVRYENTTFITWITSLYDLEFVLVCILLAVSFLFFSARHVSFYETAAADGVLGYLIAFLVLLATVKLWHLLRLNPKLHMITATLQRAWNDISGFIVVMTIMLLAYAMAVRNWFCSSHMTALNI